MLTFSCHIRKLLDVLFPCSEDFKCCRGNAIECCIIEVQQPLAVEDLSALIVEVTRNGFDQRKRSSQRIRARIMGGSVSFYDCSSQQDLRDFELLVDVAKDHIERITNFVQIGRR
jgi:hypothetical protein